MATVNATLFNVVLQQFSIKERILSPFLSPSGSNDEMPSKSLSNLNLLMSRNSEARSQDDSPSLHNSVIDSSNSGEVTCREHNNGNNFMNDSLV